MKSKTAFTAILSLSLFAAGCGEYSKSPEGDLGELREWQKTQDGKNNGPVIKYVEKPVEQPPQVVYREQAKIGRDAIIISTGTLMTFSEGVKSQYAIRTAVTVPGVKIKLKVTNFPKEISLEESKTEAGVFLLTWTPEFYTIPSGETQKTFVAKALPEIIAGDAKVVEALRGLDLSQDFVVQVLPTQELPSALSVGGLAAEVVEGTVVPFTVTVKVPGVDDKSADKPTLEVSYDNISVSEGNNFLEMDGTRHVLPDVTKKAPEYLGDYQWKFNLLFDTAKITRQTQLAKDGSELFNADGTRVRFSLKAKGGRNLMTPTKLVQVKIKALPKPEVTLSPEPTPQATPVAKKDTASTTDNKATSTTKNTTTKKETK